MCSSASLLEVAPFELSLPAVQWVKLCTAPGQATKSQDASASGSLLSDRFIVCGRHRLSLRQTDRGVAARQ